MVPRGPETRQGSLWETLRGEGIGFLTLSVSHSEDGWTPMVID